MSLTHVNKQIRNEFLPIFQNLMVSRPPNESQDLIHAVPATAPSCGSGSRSSRFSHLIVYLRLYGFEVYRKTFVLSPRTPPQHSLIVLDLDYGEIGHLIDAHELLTLCDKYPGLIMASTGHSPTLRAYFKFPFHGTYYTITASETSTIFNNMFRQSSVILKNKTPMNGLKSISFQGWRHGMGLWIEYNNVPNDLAIIVEKCRLWCKVLVGSEIPCVGLPELE
ncbi:hypothetical protein SLS60_011534 [Paraconiothyrium brasiliense]|uniref:Uncharacterized protein n=1 Tax=Paraconiothyrium brasiliense TaxID=300254 RepID=A0ABR3QJB9_9PLEO